MHTQQWWLYAVLQTQGRRHNRPVRIRKDKQSRNAVGSALFCAPISTLSASYGSLKRWPAGEDMEEGSLGAELGWCQQGDL